MYNEDGLQQRKEEVLVSINQHLPKRIQLLLGIMIALLLIGLAGYIAMPNQALSKQQDVGLQVGYQFEQITVDPATEQLLLETQQRVLAERLNRQTITNPRSQSEEMTDDGRQVDYQFEQITVDSQTAQRLLETQKRILEQRYPKP